MLEWELDTDPANISWIGTVQSGLLVLGVVYSGKLYDCGYLKALTITGNFLIVFGMFMTSLCTEFWGLLVTQGFIMGLGMGFLFVPMMAVLSSWFNRKRGLAIGLAGSGSTIGLRAAIFDEQALTILGGIIYPILFYRLVDSVGFPWTCRAIASVLLFFSVLPIFALRSIVQPRVVRRFFDFKPFREAGFSLFTVGVAIAYLGLYVPYYWIQLYALDDILITEDFSFYLLALVNAASLIGRIVSLVLKHFLHLENVLTASDRWRASRLHRPSQRHPPHQRRLQRHQLQLADSEQLFNSRGLRPSLRTLHRFVREPPHHRSCRHIVP